MDSKLERQALALPIGHKKKVLHCGSSPSMSMSAKLKGTHLYCHRCGYTEWIHRDISQISLETLSALHTEQSREARLPPDFSTNFESNDPTCLAALIWYAKSGITDRLRREYKLGWSKKYGRAVIPVYSGTKLTAVVYRRLHTHDQNRAKYVCFGDGTAASSVFISKPEKSACSSEAFLNLRSTYRIVIVEDTLSCIRVGEFVTSGSLLGTSSSDEKVQSLLSATSGQNGLVGIWLDPDQAGMTGAGKLQRYLALQGIEARTILSHKDPKALSDREIIRRLSLDEYDRCDLAPDYEDPRRIQ